MVDPSATTLRLDGEHVRRLERWARAGYPMETCGLLVGLREGPTTWVHRVWPGRNVESAPCRRFELHPGDIVAGEDRAADLGLKVVGIWHTHPDGHSEPSEADRTGAWEGWSYLVVAILGGRVTLRAWRLHGRGFVEEEIHPPLLRP